MGVCCSHADTDSAQRSARIDQLIADESKKSKRICKILLLGSGESGKSTIVKQMKIIHKNGYSLEELGRMKITVGTNIMESIIAVATAMERFGMNSHNEQIRAYCEFLRTKPFNTTPVLLDKVPHIVVKSTDMQTEQQSNDAVPEMNPFSESWKTIIEGIWSDPARMQLFEQHGSDFYMMDNAPYFFENISRIVAHGYLPTEEDVLKSRHKTTGIIETQFVTRNLEIHMIDVGGQRTERKKWIHCFEGVTCIIFCVALSEYDLVLLEDETKNRLQESLDLFALTVNSRWFQRSSIILFMNKADLFKTKLKTKPLEKYFREYSGDPDVNVAAKFILWRFQQLNRSKLSIYPHLTQATDTRNIRRVFEAVQATLLKNALSMTGML